MNQRVKDVLEMIFIFAVVIGFIILALLVSYEDDPQIMVPTKSSAPWDKR
jgi:hypothetical protein